jgi:hypothetical protein
MIQVGRDDLLRALKRLKGLAKQDILASDLTPYPQFWKAHAEARRAEYANLIQLVEEADIEKACAYAFSTYSTLPGVLEGDQVFAEAKGREQAIELYFRIVGVDVDQLRVARNEHLELQAFLSKQPQIYYEYYHSLV